MVSIIIFNFGVGTTNSFENILQNKKSSSPEKKKKPLCNDLQKFSSERRLTDTILRSHCIGEQNICKKTASDYHFSVCLCT